MALPPTEIYRYVRGDEQTYKNLRRAGLLRRDVDREEFLAALRRAAESHHLPDGMVGPNVTDSMVHALGGFLNERGSFLAATPSRDVYYDRRLRLRVFMTRVLARVLR